MSEYAKRDHMQLDREGGHYSRHVSAMTAEGLHAKSDIAGELAFRDWKIAALTDRLDKAERERERLRSESKAQLEELGRIDDALGTNEGPSAVDHIMILKTENERLREDAERYRWLRGSADIPAHSTRWARWEVRRWDGRYWSTIFTEQVDAEIDAALAAEKGKE